MAIELTKRLKAGQKDTPTRTVSKKHEDSIAKATGGQRTPNSGATTWVKGDILLENWLLEAKTKMAHSDSIKINKEWFDKNNQEKAFMGKEHSAIVFNFGPGEANHYIIDEYLFQDLLEYLKTKKE